MIAWWVVPAWAACPAAPADVAEAAARAEAAWIALDADALARAEDDVRERCACVTAPLGPADAFGVWVTVALGAYVGGDRGAAGVALGSARLADPAGTLPSEVAGPGHPLRGLWDTVSAPSAWLDLPAGDGRTYRVDGHPAVRAPADRPYLVQVFADGELVSTALLTTSALPSAPVPAPRLVVPLPDPVAWHRRPWSRVGLGLVAAGVGFEIGDVASVYRARSYRDDLRGAADVASLDAAYAAQQRARTWAYALRTFGVTTLAVGVGLQVPLGAGSRRGGP